MKSDSKNHKNNTFKLKIRNKNYLTTKIRKISII